MCNRYRIKETDALSEDLRERFGIPDWVRDNSRFNIAPTHDCPLLVMDDEGDVIVPATMRWGLIPFWSGPDKPAKPLLNARSEKVATSGAFKQSLQKRRCLVPADGFYEWLHVGNQKYAFDIHLKGGRPFVMAGLYEKAVPGRPATFAILTTAPNEMMAKIHERMPAIFGTAEAKAWMRPGDITPERVAELTRAYSAEDMEAIPISSLVNSPKNDVPEVLEPVAFIPPPRPSTRLVQSELF
jgi:putative SOS response-associated peptidase YedK